MSQIRIVATIRRPIRLVSAQLARKSKIFELHGSQGHGAMERSYSLPFIIVKPNMDLPPSITPLG